MYAAPHESISLVPCHFVDHMIFLLKLCFQSINWILNTCKCTCNKCLKYHYTMFIVITYPMQSHHLLHDLLMPSRHPPLSYLILLIFHTMYLPCIHSYLMMFYHQILVPPSLGARTESIVWTIWTNVCWFT